jgi:hypothetical protein
MNGRSSSLGKKGTRDSFRDARAVTARSSSDDLDEAGAHPPGQQHDIGRRGEPEPLEPRGVERRRLDRGRARRRRVERVERLLQHEVLGEPREPVRLTRRRTPFITISGSGIGGSGRPAAGRPGAGGRQTSEATRARARASERGRERRRGGTEANEEVG